MRGLSDKVVIVAGGATGIGAATAQRLGEEGARVLVGDLNGDGARDTAGKITGAGGQAEPFEFDISDEQSCAALVAAAKDHWGRVDGLFNVAADLSQNTLGRDADIVSTPLEVIERTLDVNLMGFVYTVRAAIPAMLESGGGSIVNTTSGVVRGVPNFGAYVMSKGAIISLSRHIATRWGKELIRCNAIDPGVTLTQNQLDSNPEELRAMLLPIVKAPNFGEPEDIAAGVSFLLSDDARWINGQTYVISSMDGAW